MSKYKVHIERIRDTGRQTLGRLTIYAGEMMQYQCVTLEPSFVLNQSYISCIPTGKYPLEKRRSRKYDEHFHIKNVPNRSYTLIHAMNFYKQSEGCVGPGKRFKYLNDDNEFDVTSSRDTLGDLLKYLPDKTILLVSNHKSFQRFYNQADDAELLMDGLKN